MGNCRNTLPNVARKKSGGGVRQAIAGSLLFIIVHLEHSWHANVYSRANGSGGPYCAGRVAVITYFIT